MRAILGIHFSLDYPQSGCATHGLLRADNILEHDGLGILHPKSLTEPGDMELACEVRIPEGIFFNIFTQSHSALTGSVSDQTDHL